MGAIDNFLKRWGFARLDRYGLVLTPEDRVMSTRPAVLDDGLGGKIVGWLEGDLAAMELEHWGAPPRKAKKKVVAPASLHKLPPSTPQAARTIAPAAPASAAPVISAPVITAPAVAAPRAPIAAPAPVPSPIAASSIAAPPAPAPAPAAPVADGDEPGEDEWEWEIAMARARAAADETEAARAELLGAAASIESPVAQRKMIPAKTSPGVAVAATRSPISTRSAVPEPEPLPPWPGTEPYNETWADRSEVAPQVMSVLQKKLAVARRTPAKPTPTVAAPASGRATVIPVPQLPTAADPRTVRPPAYTPSAPKGRTARGTGSPTRLEETVRTQAAPPANANDDRTSPYIELPSEVKPSGFAHTKRVAARER